MRVIAEAFAVAGIAAFPCLSTKAPACGGGFHSATLSPDDFVWPADGLVGVAIPPGIVVVDVDVHKGMSTGEIDRAVGVPLDWESSFLQHTRSGGAHYAFRCDEVDSLNHGSNLFADIIGEGFDTRCAGRGYICTGAGYSDGSSGTVLKLAPSLSTALLPALPPAAIEKLSMRVINTSPSPPTTAQPAGSVPPEMLRSALNALPVEYAAERGKWFEVACGIKAALGDAGWRIFDEFSRRAPERYSERENIHQWNSIKPHREQGNSINVETILFHARANGWNDAQFMGFGVPVSAAPQLPAWATTVNLADVMIDAAPPCFVTDAILPAGTTTLLGAHGGTGKSMLALQWSIAVVLGLPFFETPTKQQRVLFYSAEDNADVIRWRVRKICKQQNIEPSTLADLLLVLDATEIDATLYAEDARTRVAGTTTSYDQLLGAAHAHQAGMIIIDNASDIFGANENERSKVRGLVRSLNTMAKQTGAAVLLLSHVDKQTAKGVGGNSEGYSGSTAWHNSVRSRLFLSERDGLLELQHQKSNHGRRADPMHLAFNAEGVLVPSILGLRTSTAPTQQLDDTHTVLTLIHEFTRRGESVPTAPTANGNARRLLSGQPNFPTRWRTGHGLFDALRDAERQGLIHRVVYRTHDRKERERWQVSDEFIACASIAPAPRQHEASTAGAPLRSHGLGVIGGGARAHAEALPNIEPARLSG